MVNNNKDNNINITKYLEFNKDRILDLAEKNYENLVEALTNDAIANVFLQSYIIIAFTSSTFSDPLIKMVPTE